VDECVRRNGWDHRAIVGWWMSQFGCDAMPQKKKWWIGWMFEGKRMRWPSNGWMRNGGVGSRIPRSHSYAAFCVSGACLVRATDIGFLQGREVESSSQCCPFVSARKQGFYRYAGC
jgi:hypothetical protein